MRPSECSPPGRGLRSNGERKATVTIQDPDRVKQIGRDTKGGAVQDREAVPCYDTRSVATGHTRGVGGVGTAGGAAVVVSTVRRLRWSRRTRTHRVPCYTSVGGHMMWGRRARGERA